MEKDTGLNESIYSYRLSFLQYTIEFRKAGEYESVLPL